MRNIAQIPAYQQPETVASPDVMIDGKVVIPTVPAPEIGADQIEDCVALADQAARLGEPFGAYVVRHVSGQGIVNIVRKIWGEDSRLPQLFLGNGQPVHQDYTNLRAGDSPVTLHHTFYGKVAMVQFQNSTEIDKSAPTVSWTTDDSFPRDKDFSLPSFAFTAELEGYTNKNPQMHHVKLPARIGDLVIFFHSNPHCFTELTFPRSSETWYK